MYSFSIIGDGIHIWEKAAGNHMFVLYHHDKVVEDPKKHFKTGNAKDFFKKSDFMNKKAQTKPKLTFGLFTS